MTMSSLKQVAAAAGVSEMTASRALRNAPRVSATTRAKVLKVAKKLGYQPDPTVVRLMHQLRRPKTERANIAMVWFEGRDQSFSTMKIMVAGATARARKFGFNLSHHAVNAYPDGASLCRVLRQRGIEGIILVAMTVVDGLADKNAMPWDQFAWTVVGLGYQGPALNRVHFDQFRTATTILRQVTTLGYRRPGWVVETDTHTRMEGAWRGAFMAQAEDAPDAARRFRLSSPDFQETNLADWIRDERIDAVVLSTANAKFLSGQISAGTVPPVGIALMDWQPAEKAFAGYDQRYDVLGAHAVDALAALLYRNERGIVASPKEIVHLGDWHPGPSLPQKR
jgi:LacI family transcriptional regulator